MNEGQKSSEKIRACTIARDIEQFDLLIEDMEQELGPEWGGLTFENAVDTLNSDVAANLEFVAVAVDRQDEPELVTIASVIRAAKEMDINVILIPHDLDTVALHQLMRVGADDFAPYPLPEGALKDAIDRIAAAKEASRAPAPATAAPAEPAPLQQPLAAGGDRSGVVLPVYGLAGGVGTSTFATNLAWELQQLVEEQDKRVCIIDLDFQFGSVSTYLDIDRTETAFEFWSDLASADTGALRQIMDKYRDKLDVLPSAPEALPLEFAGPDEIGHLIELARSTYDFVIIDVPQPLVSWSEVVLEAAHLYFAVIGLDMRTAQNIQRFMRTLKAEDLPHEKVQFVLNFAPKFTDMTGRGRVKTLRDSLEIELKFQLPDGGKPVLMACDEGEPLGLNTPKNALRREIVKVAETISELAEADTEETEF